LNQLIEIYEIGVNVIPPEATQTSPQTNEIGSVMADRRTCEMNMQQQPSSCRTLKWCAIITMITFLGYFRVEYKTPKRRNLILRSVIPVV